MRSLRVRLTLWYIGILGILLLLGACMLYLAGQKALLTETDAFLRGEGRHIAASCTDTGSPDLAEIQEALTSATGQGPAPGKSSAFLSFDMSYARVLKYTDTGAAGQSGTNQFQVIAQSPTLEAAPSVSQALDVLMNRPQLKSTGGQFGGSNEEDRLRVLLIPVRFGSGDGAVQVAVPWDHNADILEHLGIVLTACLMLVLLVSGAGGWILIARTLHPIARIVEEADRLDASDLPAALIPEASESDTEVGRLVVTLNRMMTRLRTAFDAQRRFAEAQQRFAADASHELRTPLTILRGEMDVALARRRDADAYRAVIASAVEEIDRMSRIVEGLSLAAEYDAENLSPNSRIETIDILMLALITADELRGKAALNNITIRTRGAESSDPRLMVVGDPEQIRLLLRNLIDNAVKYTNPEGYVDITVSARPNWETPHGDIVITVKDNGIGIASDDLPYIFDRFWRADRTRNREGSGLGLAISRQIATAYGGSLTCASRLGSGTEFTLQLPSAGHLNSQPLRLQD